MSDEVRLFLAAWGCFAVCGGIVFYAWHTRFVADDPEEPRCGVVTPPVSDSVERELQDIVASAARRQS